MLSHEELKRKILTAFKILRKLDLTDYAGSVSALIPDVDDILINASIFDTGDTSLSDPETVVTIDINGKLLNGRFPPPNETPLHTSIYKLRDDVKSVVHIHPTLSTAFSIVETEILPVYVRGAEVVAKGVPIFQNPDPIKNEELGFALAKTLNGSRACLMRSHGLVTVGRTIEEASLASINLEQLLKIQFIATILGNPRPMPQKNAEERIKLWSNPNWIKKIWRYYESMV